MLPRPLLTLPCPLLPLPAANPSAADFYLIPAALRFARNRTIHDVVEHVRKLPYWDRSNGSDHFWVRQAAGTRAASACGPGRCCCTPAS